MNGIVRCENRRGSALLKCNNALYILIECLPPAGPLSGLARLGPHPAYMPAPPTLLVAMPLLQSNRAVVGLPWASSTPPPRKLCMFVSDTLPSSDEELDLRSGSPRTLHCTVLMSSREPCSCGLIVGSPSLSMTLLSMDVGVKWLGSPQVGDMTTDQSFAMSHAFGIVDPLKMYDRLIRRLLCFDARFLLLHVLLTCEGLASR